MKTWVSLAATLVLAACTTGSGTSDRQASILERFNQHLAGCTARHGYDPGKTEDLGPHQLGENERAWDECVYDGVERYLAVNSPVPKAYDALVATHKTLTNKVESGEITREQRRTEVQALFESIRRDEAALYEQQASSRKAKSDRETQREIERIRRDVDQTRRTLLNSM